MSWQPCVLDSVISTLFAAFLKTTLLQLPAITGALLDLLCVRKLNSEAAVLTSGLVPNMWGARGLVELFVMSQMADSLPCKR